MAIAPNEIQKRLRGLDYPCSKQMIIDTARKEGAGQEVIDLLQKFPDREYNSSKDVMQVFGDVSRHI